MCRLTGILVLATVALAFARADGLTDAELRKKPITADGGEIGRLLKKWDAEATAAGNVGDWYDNRDGEHSPLDLRPWPQLEKIQYTPEDFKRRRNWAAQRELHKRVVFGNSSTSAPPTQGGSNPMQYYTQPAGLAFLEQQYLKNNVYIYPEHRDHDPGHNGRGDGYGDLYPTNTPYLFISQGSSGSDQPFMRAIPFTLAAFRPDVKKLLVEKGLLMPTLQCVFRASNKNVTKPEDYFTGKAHPTVFEGSNVDAIKMVKTAHAITKDTIPPLVKLKVVEEDTPENGRDFFELPGRTERLGDTSSVIARVWRGKSETRRMSVSVKDSVDVNGKKLTFKWVLLRGDPERVKITPRDDGAEIVVKYHGRRPIAPGSAMESNRVDIGVFAENGVAVSAPAFITWFSLDSERRAGQHILHGACVSHVTVTDWGKMLAPGALAAKALGVTDAERDALQAVAKLAGELETELAGVRGERQKAEKKRGEENARKASAEATLKKTKDEDEAIKTKAALAEAQMAVKVLDEQLKKIDGRLKEVEAALNKALDATPDGLKSSARAFVQGKLDAALKDKYLHNRLRKDLKETPHLTALRKKLLALIDILDDKDGWAFPDEMGHADGPLGEYNGALLEAVLPGAVRATITRNYVDARLASPRLWVDTHEKDGSWRRRQPGREDADFTPEGWVVTGRDKEKRPVQARTVVYRLPAVKGATFFNPPPLTWALGPELITFAYEGGRRVVKSREKVEDPAG